MKKKHRKFLKLLKKHFKAFPETRITQALFNLGVTESAGVDDEDVNTGKYYKDNYNQSDEKTIEIAEEAYHKLYKQEFKRLEKESLCG